MDDSFYQLNWRHPENPDPNILISTTLEDITKHLQIILTDPKNTKIKLTLTNPAQYHYTANLQRKKVSDETQTILATYRTGTAKDDPNPQLPNTLTPRPLEL